MQNFRVCVFMRVSKQYISTRLLQIKRIIALIVLRSYIISFQPVTTAFQ